MPIKVICKSCQKSIKTTEKYAGKRVKCPSCQAPLVIPTLESWQVATPQAISLESWQVATPQATSEDIQPSNTHIKKNRTGANRKRPTTKARKQSRSSVSPKPKAIQSDSRATRPSKKDVHLSAKPIVFLMAGTFSGFLLISFLIWSTLGGEGGSQGQAVTAQIQGTDRSLLSYMPKAEGYGGFNLEKLLAIPALREDLSSMDEAKLVKALESISDSPEGKALAEELKSSGGLKVIQEHLADVAFSMASFEGDSMKPRGLILLKTKGSAAATMEWFSKAFISPVQPSVMDGMSVYTMPGEEDLACAIDEHIVALASDEAMLKSVIAIQKGEAEGQSDLSSSSKLAWFNWVSQGKAPVPAQSGMPFQPEDLLSAQIGVDYDDVKGLTIELLTRWKSAEQVSQLQGEFSMQLGFLMEMMLQLDEKNWNLSAEADQLILNVNLSPEELDSFKNMGQMQIQMQGQGSVQMQQHMQGQGSVQMQQPTRKIVSIPKRTVEGSVHAKAFKLAKTTWNPVTKILELKSDDEFFSDRSLQIWTFIDKENSPVGKQFLVPGHLGSTPHIYKDWKVEGKGFPETKTFRSDYEMQLTFTSMEDGILKGEIDLILNDEEGTKISGQFDATVKE